MLGWPAQFLHRGNPPSPKIAMHSRCNFYSNFVVLGPQRASST